MSNCSWQKYIEAAHRKLAISDYHVDRLREALNNHTNSSGSTPSIAVQAHFEGVVVSVMAAVDQVAQAVNSACQLHLNPSNLVEEAFTIITEHLPEIGDWFSEQIGRDLRRLRVRMVHYTYVKTQQAEHWIVESVGTGFGGSRELVDYAKSAVEYGGRLRSLLSRIDQEVAIRIRSETASRQT